MKGTVKLISFTTYLLTESEVFMGKSQTSKASIKDFLVKTECSRLIKYFIIWLAPRAGKMNQILRCDWLPEQAR